ncbi:hypothetical protein FRC06_008043, partial [Ceratobasidium sp. 370]
LWSQIIINGKFPPSRALVDISRAGPTCSLDIDIDFTTRPINYTYSIRDNARSIQRLLTRLTTSGATFDRWRSLRVVTRSIRDICAILESVDGDMPVLEALGVRVLLLPNQVYNEGSLSGSFSINPLLGLFERSPRLRTFELAKFDHLLWKMSSCFPSMKNITHIELALCVTPTLSDFRSLLVNNPYLETLVVEIPEPFDGDGENRLLRPDTTSVSLVRLQTLALMVEIIPVGWCQRALQLIDAPNLTSFRLGIDRWPSVGACWTIMKFLCSNRCTFISPTLRHLSLGPFRCGLDEYYDLFTICSNLVRLDWVVEQHRTYSLILSHSPWLLPKLSWMRISGVTLDVPLDLILSQTVVGRRNAGLPLRVVEVGAGDWANVHPDVKSHLRGMVEKIGPFEEVSESQTREVGGEDTDSEEGNESEAASQESEEWSDDT